MRNAHSHKDFYMPDAKPPVDEEIFKKSDEYLNLVINCISDPVFIKNDQQKLVFANDALCSLTGKRREELIGRTIEEIQTECQARSLWDQEMSVLKTGEDFIDEEEIVDPDGNKRNIVTSRRKLPDNAGNNHIVGIIRDITERKRLEAQYLQAQKMETIGVLTGGVVHDFNNLLNVINGYTELLLDDLEADDPRRNDLELIRQAAKRAVSLTSQLHAFSRKQIFSPRILDLNAVIIELNKILCRLIGEDIELVCSTPPGVGSIYADLGQIQQIILNLAVNARESMPIGGTLNIETARIIVDQNSGENHEGMAPGSYLCLTLSDTGIGMDAQTLSHIFDPESGGKGAGLGLSAVYDIVRQSGGHIRVDSERGKGSRFRIYFAHKEEEKDKPTEKKEKQTRLSGSETVLVAEDESMVRALTARILRDHGYKVMEASNGTEALRLYQEHSEIIDMVLTDVVMPQMGGKELVEKISAIRPDIKALYVSGYANSAILRHGVLDTGIPLLQKPFSVNMLLRKIRELLDEA
jgi:two-component system, cell cycle sensor histidine kinase and response regulator CckA